MTKESIHLIGEAFDISVKSKMTNEEIRKNYELLTETEREAYVEMVIQGTDREYAFDLLRRLRKDIEKCL